MLAPEHATRLAVSIAAIDHATEDAVMATAALAAAGGVEAGRWLPGIRQALERIQLECADLRFATRALRDTLPSSTTLQPRLL